MTFVLPAPRLPEGFEALEPFVLGWAQRDAGARAELLRDVPADDLAAFGSAMRAHVRAAVDLLEIREPAALDAREANLLCLLAIFTEIAPARPDATDGRTDGPVGDIRRRLAHLLHP